MLSLCSHVRAEQGEEQAFVHVAVFQQFHAVGQRAADFAAVVLFGQQFGGKAGGLFGRYGLQQVGQAGAERGQPDAADGGVGQAAQ